MNSSYKTNELNDGRTIEYVVNSVMRTLVYEHILAQKHLYLINIYEASLIIVNKMVKCKPKTINAINRLRPLAISDTITNMFEQILLHHIDVNKKTIKKTT
jgi:hypothetical protein